MKALLLITTLIFLVSCGKHKHEYITVVQSGYDDSQTQALLVIQDARIKALEDRLNYLENEFGDVVIDFDERFNNLDQSNIDLNASLALLNNALTNLQTKQLSIVSICSSSEKLIKTNDGLYAVYMISNNYGTYLGKLVENVNYRTTDASQTNFKIVNGQVVCL